MAYPGEREILNFLKDSGEQDLETVSESCRLNIDTARRAVESLKDKGFVKVEKKSATMYMNSDEFESYLSKNQMPEFEVFKLAQKGLKILDLDPTQKSVGLSWAIKKGLVKIESTNLVPLKNEKDAQKINSSLLSRGLINNDKEIQNELIKRKLIEERVSTTYSLSITPKGRKILEEDGFSTEFSVNVQTADATIGKTHPLSRAIMKIKEIFLEMGFEEMDGDCIESTFWNFDALFQPQDHPARELADTFYVDKHFALPDKSLVRRVKDSHENGWKYQWKESEARRGVLRTHTTCLSARALAALKAPYKKYFSVGRVFRNEETDFKHLAEFHQVEGIVVWKDATFRDLLGILKEFYRKLGFDKIRFRPSYFPYTEPSLEIEVYYEPRKEWMELGGAGIFRPEVTKPLTNIYPVLAWGLSLERPLMLSLGLNDIRTFYRNDLTWLKSTRVRGWM